MITETLKRTFELKEKELEAFLFLVENGPQSAGNLAKKTGISRPSLYGFMHRLQNLNLVILSQKNGVRVFTAQPKERIEQVIDTKIKDLEKGRESIGKLFVELARSGATVSPKFQLFEGKEGLKHVLQDMLLYRDIETKAYWPIKSMLEILSADFFRTLNKERIRRRLYTRAIWPENQTVDIKKYPYLGAGKGFYREIRIAPKQIAFSMGYWIYGNKVAFISSKKEAFGYIIESKELVEMLSSQFEVIWHMSKKLAGAEKEGKVFLEEMKREG